MREKTFTDESLTTQAAVDARANALLNQYAYPIFELPVELAEKFILTPNDVFGIDSQKINYYDDETLIDSVTYGYSGAGLSTSLNAYYKGTTMADILIDVSRGLP